VVENPCTGGLVEVAGEEQIVINGVTTDPTKGYLHYDVSTTASGTGLGADGTKYVFDNSEHFVLESPNFPSPETVITSKGSFEFISTDGSPNFVEHVVFHLTILPSGEFKTTTDFDRAECRG
jgi:hypothetical protein